MSSKLFPTAPMRAALLSLAVNVALAVLIPLPAYADSPAEMQLRSAVNAAIDAARTNATQLTIQQTAARASSVWNKLNVRQGETLLIDMKSNWSHMASIADQSPSTFAGKVNAAGHLYLINTNGIIFANGAQVNVGSLVASTLNISEDLFLSGIQSNIDQAGMPVFSAFPGASDGLIRVEQGAALTSETGGRVMLLAQNVENNGLITTPEGQTILAAGGKVFLAVSDDPRLRGFLVEVDNGGSVTNTGVVIAERGNVSMTGLTVNQLGRVTATTSSTLNGSIRLMARDTVLPYKPPAEVGKAEPRPIPLGTTPGNLVFGKGSVTEVLPEVSATATLTDEQTFNRSSIQGVGRTIHVQGDSLIRAQGGEIALDAQAGQLFQGASKEQGVRLQVDSGAVLDVSGLLDVPIPVERNYIQVELRGDQLKDSPQQRDTFLYKSKVWIDVEKGTPLADVKADIGKLARTVAEKSAKGGDITLRSEGDMVLQSGSQVNVSGGSLAYQAGFGRTTQLLLNGKVVDIGQADPEQVYSGFADQYTITDPKWGVTRTYDLGRPIYIPGYTAGRDAGTVTLETHGLVADASFIGKAIAGENQRSQIPLSGQLKVIGLVNAGTTLDPLQNLSFVTARTGVSPGLNDKLPDDLVLSTDFLDRGGFGRLAVYSEGRITLAKDVALNTAPKGSVTLSGRQLEIDGDISAPGGEITLTTRATSSATSTDRDDYLLRVGSDAYLSTRALWINDLPTLGAAGTGSIVTKGGNITLSAVADLDLQAGSVLDVGGGGWVKADGKTRLGNAGQITLSSGRFGFFGAADAQISSMRLSGELRAYALGDGGKLTLDASSLYLGAVGTGKAGELVLGEAFFHSGGFKDYDLGGVDGVTLADGFQLQPRPLTAVLARESGLYASGSDLSRFSALQALDGDLRQPGSVTLRATSVIHGNLKVGEKTLVQVDPQGSINLSATQQLTVLGTLAAPAGSIVLSQSKPNPEPTGSDAFDAGRSIFLGERSRLLATGYYRAQPNARGLRKGEVMDGGTVSIDAAKGYLIAQQGSLIDVSGVSATLDLVDASGLASRTVGSNGGVITLSAREGMLLEGGLSGHAGSRQAMGGSLNLHLNRNKVRWSQDSLNSQRAITLQADPTALTAGLVAGAALDTTQLNGRARLAQSQVQLGGFDSLTLESENRIEFADTLNLNLNGRLSLYAPNLAAPGASSANLSAASLILGNPSQNAQPEALRNDASGGAGKLTLNAGLIELVGNTNMQGFGEVNLVSQGDIRFRSVVFDDPITIDVDYANTGSLATGGNLNLAARQIYPTSMAKFALEVHNNPAGRISITSTGAENPVLSAGGKLSLRAPFIEQRGTIKAPFGEITLKSEAITRTTTSFVNGLPNTHTLARASAVGGEVVLAANSLTSVSAEGQIIPLGYTELSGRDWVYDLGLLKQVLATSPEKRVVLDGETVTVAGGARLDLSGGGDIYAYEFLKGPGGSKDILLPGNSTGLYAVLPGLGSSFAPFDYQTYQGLGNWNPGASVQLLEGASGLAAGNYALLPARYALLPGAFLVRVQQANSDLLPGRGQVLPNGAVLVAGYLGGATASGGVRHGARTATIEVRPGGVARQYSEYLDTLASSKFANLVGAQQPGDAGRLSIAVGKSLSLEGDLLANYASGRRGPEVDISALKLAVTADGSSYAADYVTLSASQLDSLGATSLLLGGTRSVSADGGQVRVEQRSQHVVVSEKTELAAPELILVARDTVKLEKGSLVDAKGTFSGQAKDIYVTDAAGNGDGALLRVSTSEQVSMTRASASLIGGVLDVAGATVDATGAVVKAAAVVRGKSVILDATLDNRTLGDVILPENGGALTLGATRISLAEKGKVVKTSGLVFDQDRLKDLGNPAHLIMRSYSTLDLYGNVKLGGTGLASLGIEAAGIAGYGAAGESALLQADRVSFANPDGIKAATAFTGTTGQSDLAVQARDVELGKGDFTLRGFQNTKLTATGQVLGLGGSLKAEGGGADGNLSLNAGRITVVAGGSQKILADGDLLTSRHPAPVDSGAARLGGKLEMAGATLTHGGRIELPAGEVILRSTGTGDVILLSGSEIRAGGATVAFADTRAHASGGRVSLESRKGNVDIQSGAVIDVAGDMTKDTGGGDAGVLAVWAAGDAKVEGTLLGDAASGYDSARFQLEANHINKNAVGANDFTALNKALEAGGFHQSRQIRVRQGDVKIATMDSVKAREFLLAADQGKISVAGTVDASGAKGGRIELYAGGDLDLLKDAKLLAKASDSLAAAKGTAGEGGLVVLGSGDTGKLNIASGAEIDVSVPIGSAARAGRVVLRAARTGSGAGDGVALGTMEGKIAGAERVDLEAYKVYDGVTELTAGASSGSALGLSTVKADNDAFVAAVNLNNLKNKTTLKGKLDTGASSFRLLPGVEARNSGDIKLAADWNLTPLRHGGEAGVLTLRAGGNLDLAASLSDGFSTVTKAGVLQTSPTSWSYRLAAGADSGAADPLATHRNVSTDHGDRVLILGKEVDTGDLKTAANTLVRTGSGNIHVAAARDVLLGSGAAIYSAGHATPALSGFSVKPNIAGNAFPTGGGDVRIRAGGSVASETGPSGLVTDWLYRQGRLLVGSSSDDLRSPGWWPQISQFKNGIGALGGGDVDIAAGDRVANLLAVTATNARQPASFGAAVDASKQVVQGGGDLSVRAGGDIEGGVFFVDRGVGRIVAGGAMTAGLARTNQKVGATLAIGDASASVSARLDLNLESVVNPTLVQQADGNLAGGNGSSRESYFVSYGADSATRLLSVAGDTHLVNGTGALATAYGVSVALSAYPGNLQAVSLLGDIVMDNGFTLAPSALGDLRLLAGGSVRAGGTINLSDVALSKVPTLTAPRTSTSEVKFTSPLFSGVEVHAAVPLHLADTRPVYVVAREGDIVGPKGSNDIFAVLAKSAVFQAGRDIRNVTVYGQNLRDTDVTRFLAGRDLVFNIERGSTGVLSADNQKRIAIGGPGQVQIIAGRNIDLGTSQGVVTRGNLNNPFLPEGGADLLVIAGASPRDKNGNALPINPAFMDDLVLRNFFAELLKSAKESSANKDYSRGEAAIANLFPTGTVEAPLTYQGDINLFFSQLKTEQGGDIRMLAPGGLVNAGLASLTAFDRKAADLGIMTVQGGDIQAYTQGDFLVNSSRVFTITGGDLLLWSSKGNIDAGKGAKTATATPPPQLRIDNDGNFVLDVSQSISGSGIGALKAGSDVYLIAPKGEVNAGDAGIRSAGNLLIAAQRVVGADNIQVGGVATGVPVESASLGGSLAGVSGIGDASKTTDEQTKALSNAARDGDRAMKDARDAMGNFRPSFITVEVMGFGESGTANEGECRRPDGSIDPACKRSKEKEI